MIVCRFEQGNETDQLRHTVADVVCVDGSRVLLVKRAEWLLEGGKWALPGGFMDRDETLAECARRELLEETGYECKNLQLLTLDSRPNRRNDDRQNVTGVFICNPADRVQEPDDESTDIEWFEMSSVANSSDIAFGHEVFIRLAMAYVDEGFQIPVLDSAPVI